MKKIIYALMLFLQTSATLARDIEVWGESENGDFVYGTVEHEKSFLGSGDVEGTLYNDDGDQVQFEGEVQDDGTIEGHDENFNRIELEPAETEW